MLDFLDEFANERDFFSRVITYNESRIFEYFPETRNKLRSCTLQTPDLPKSSNEQIEDQINTDLLVCLICLESLHKRICSSGPTINQVFFIKASLKGSEEKGSLSVRPDVADKWIFHHDNCHVTPS
ncbi:hypothetical protein TNIN_330691 [Trichonephila inaurata madagascariensis]|uniref:Uncharacterized protein n=1 Tax=Trichonephila inaurata madagascariensis TaxID=2747483 RepID=A0A8X6WZZ5_9ARAC|nr:hypothetical protein TNIN_330691 [Trichonephila inaurata madagascariensis]